MYYISVQKYNKNLNKKYVAQIRLYVLVGKDCCHEIKDTYRGEDIHVTLEKRLLRRHGWIRVK